MRILFLLLVAPAFLVVATATAAASASRSATTDPMPTDFIDCNDPCNGGDANYELVASVQTIQMAFGNHTYRGRTFARPDPLTGRVPFGEHMGPTITVQPGQSLWIKFRNELFTTAATATSSSTSTSTSKQTGYGVSAASAEVPEEPLLPKNVTIEDYWIRLQNPGEKIKYQRYKKAVASPDLMEVDWSNIPGKYDNTNLHLHGLDVEVHMFDPVGTHNPEAPHISIQPGQCYCYRFQLPEDHPDGMYWYHPHVHGSSAVQLWGGMMGLVKVEGNLMNELSGYGVVDSRDFVIWDPAFQDIRELRPNADHDIEVDEFLNGQTTLSKIHPFLVNGEITPLFDNVGVGEVLHLRALCGTIENENTFIVYKAHDGDGDEDVDYSKWDWNESGIPFWVVASDGVTYSRPRQKIAIVMAGGQREELLLTFDEPGKYVISQQGIEGMQFFDMYGHPHDQLLAEIRVIDKGYAARLPTVPVSAMEFTPGYSPDETIQSHQISKTESIVFSMGANQNMAPFPQYYVNGKPFKQDRIDFHAYPGEAVEYILINGNHNVHPVRNAIKFYCDWVNRRSIDRKHRCMKAMDTPISATTNLTRIPSLLFPLSFLLYCFTPMSNASIILYLIS
jgi:FtsP/CotA-like multicopper oxidase with cupredoxin domain